MSKVFFENVQEHIEQLFTDDAIVENSSLFLNSPFKTLFIPTKKIAFHIIPLNAPFLNIIESTFFYKWAINASSQGIHPIHIWEDRWLAQQPIIQSQLASITKKTKTIFARNTVIKRITQPQANSFLNQNHLAGSPMARYKYGLFQKKTNNLVGVATFSAPRKYIREGKEYRSFELIRYGSSLNTTLTGGLSKVLNTFIEEVKPDDIMTYTDNDWWTGKSYLPLGFKTVELMPPIEFWLNPIENKRYTNNQIVTVLKDELNKEIKTSTQLLEKGYIKLYNSGNRKFLLTLK